MKRLFEKKSVGFYLGIAAALATLAMDIVYITLDYGDKTFSMTAFGFFLGAFAAECGVVLFDRTFLPMLPPILTGIGVGAHLYKAFPSISDLINKMVFIGGNSRLAVRFAMYFAVCGLLFVVSSFMKSNTATAVTE